MKTHVQAAEDGDCEMIRRMEVDSFQWGNLHPHKLSIGLPLNMQETPDSGNAQCLPNQQ